MTAVVVSPASLLSTQNEVRERAALENSLTKIVQAYLANFLSKHTQEAYTRDFRDFSAFLIAQGLRIQHPKEIQKEHLIDYRDYLRAHQSKDVSALVPLRGTRGSPANRF
jgi:site-specific recombinase XerD